MSVWIMQVPVLSTAHVKEDTEARLIESGQWLVAPYENGFFLYLEEDTDGVFVPEEIVPFLNWVDKTAQKVDGYGLTK